MEPPSPLTTRGGTRIGHDLRDRPAAGLSSGHAVDPLPCSSSCGGQLTRPLRSAGSLLVSKCNAMPIGSCSVGSAKPESLRAFPPHGPLRLRAFPLSSPMQWPCHERAAPQQARQLVDIVATCPHRIRLIRHRSGKLDPRCRAAVGKVAYVPGASPFPPGRRARSLRADPPQVERGAHRGASLPILGTFAIQPRTRQGKASNPVCGTNLPHCRPSGELLMAVPSGGGRHVHDPGTGTCH